jgi:bifunctional non-homologous end joining protein LigD
MSDERIVEGVRLSSPDKVLYPEQGITKSELAEYYVAVADRMLPHIAGRPITMVRCPTGRQKHCFYQRHAGSGVPPQLREIEVPGFDDPYLYIEDLPGLIALVQMGTLEIHPWGVTVARPDRPDRIIFDLDPGEGLGFAEVVRAAKEVRERLRRLGLESVVKTTGGKGLHVVVPVTPGPSWPAVKKFTRAFVNEMVRDEPRRFVASMSKSKRVGKIFVDYLRNDAEATAIGAYSPRARAGAPIALPIEWDELAPDAAQPPKFGLLDVPKLLRKRKRDPWAELDAARRSLVG